MIILGFSPDDFPRTEFKRWDFIGEIGSWGLNKKDHPEIQEIDFKIDYRKFDEWTWIKREFGFKDRVRLKFHQREGLSEEEIALIESPPEINTQDFILWALKQGYIEEANKELQRNQNNEPFDKEFSQLLYKELKDRNLISGKYSEEWQWQTSSNSLHYFIKELWNYTLPREWYARFPKKDPSISSGPDWSEHGIMHYFQYKEKTPIRLQRPIGQVDREVEIDKVIDILFEKVNDPKGKKEI